MPKRILIVEDEPALFLKLERLLQDDYELYPFTKSVEEAVQHIDTKRPDLVLLDIDLEGEYSGLDLGKKLGEDYHIPFIYVTNHKDAPTFTQGLVTGHEQYIVKAKPTLDKLELLNAIQTVLFKKEVRKDIETKDGLLATDNYLSKLKKLSAKEGLRSAIPYEDIALISTKRFLTPEGNIQKVEKNYVAFNTIGNDWYVKQGATLKEYKEILPSHFLQVNESELVNFNAASFKGRINGKNIQVNKEVIDISRTFQDVLLSM